MSRTETKVISEGETVQPEQLDVAKLQTVQWIGSCELVREGYNFTSKKYKAAKEVIPFLSWYLAIIEMIGLGAYMFVNNIPYPNFFVHFVQQVDKGTEKLLDSGANKLDWWLDVIIIRFLWFKDSLEPIFDGMVSTALYIVSSIIGFWMWVASIYIGIIKFFLSPFLRLLEQILNNTTDKKDVFSVTNVAPNKIEEKTSSPNDQEIPRIEYELDYNGQALSGTTSECESDVSVVSESWVMGHMDKFGKSYNRVGMKAKAEGRLRAAMYARLKSQMKLMRINSVSFTKGMSEYTRQLLRPKLLPVYSAVKTRLEELIVKYGLSDIYNEITKWMEKHYIISSPIRISITFAMIPLNFLENFMNQKKKSKRTRSMRSESQKRRQMPGSLQQSKDLQKLKDLQNLRDLQDSPEEADFYSYPQPQKTKLTSAETTGDSALASSVDDLCHTSDSNDGTGTLKNQTIQEEENKDDKPNIEEEEDATKNTETSEGTEEELSVTSSMMKTITGFLGRSSDEETSSDSSSESSESNDAIPPSKETENNGTMKPIAEKEAEVTTTGVQLRRKAKQGEKENRRISFSLT